MSFDLTSLPPRKGEQLGPQAVRALIDDFWRNLLPVSRAGYLSDLKRFAKWLGTGDLDQAVKILLGHGPGGANVLALRWRDELSNTRGLAPSNVNRHMSALKSLITFARTLGLVEWTIAIKGVRSQAYRDTRGPKPEEVVKLLEAADKQHGQYGSRDGALVRLLFDMALRRIEVHELSLSHLELDAASPGVWVRGKGKRERTLLPIAPPTVQALKRWLRVRGTSVPTAPLFVGVGGPWKGRRLSGRQVANVLAKLSRLAGVARVRPHGLRHSSITHALDKTGGDVRRAQAFSRHARLDTLMIYDDARQEIQKKVGEQVALPVGAGRAKRDRLLSPCCNVRGCPDYLGNDEDGGRWLVCPRCHKKWEPHPDDDLETDGGGA